MIEGILGIDVSKDTLDASMSSCNKVRVKSFGVLKTGKPFDPALAMGC